MINHVSRRVIWSGSSFKYIVLVAPGRSYWGSKAVAHLLHSISQGMIRHKLFKKSHVNTRKTILSQPGDLGIWSFLYINWPYDLKQSTGGHSVSISHHVFVNFKRENGHEQVSWSRQTVQMMKSSHSLEPSCSPGPLQTLLQCSPQSLCN